MSVTEFFSDNYQEAREKFLRVAMTFGAKCFSYENPQKDFAGRPLYTDVAYMGPVYPKKMHVTISGIHGIEGFCGSAMQLGWMSKKRFIYKDNDTGILFIHAINPYGFSYLHRENEDNVDVNRNFIDHQKAYPNNEEYEKIAKYLIPHPWESEKRKIADSYLHAFMEKDKKAFYSAILTGQYSDPTGLFFGGNSCSWSNLVIRQIFKKFIFRAEKVVVVDFHTGHGTYNDVEMYSLQPSSSESHKTVKKSFGDLLKVTPSPYPVSGSLVSALSQSLLGGEVIGCVVEYGTCKEKGRALDMLRADRWLTLHGDVHSPLGKTIKKQLKEALYPSSVEWRQNSWNIGEKILNKSLEIL